MTSDELKATIPMRDVLARYGISVNRSGMCSCPFHGKDRHPSMKIYKDGYHCFTCGANGDIFTFIQEMDHCDFKTAFITLGGTYENSKDDFFTQQRIKNAQNMREKRLKAESRHRAINHELMSASKEYRAVLPDLKPFSDEWCRIQNDLTLIDAWIESKTEEGWEVETSGVIGRYRKFKQNRNTVGRLPAGAVI